MKSKPRSLGQTFYPCSRVNRTGKSSPLPLALKSYQGIRNLGRKCLFPRKICIPALRPVRDGEVHPSSYDLRDEKGFQRKAFNRWSGHPGYSLPKLGRYKKIIHIDGFPGLAFISPLIGKGKYLSYSDSKRSGSSHGRNG